MSFVNVKNTFAVARLSSGTNCVPFTNDGTGLDGSNCDQGLVCDRLTGLCAYPQEQPCQAGSGGVCIVGFACVSDSGSLLTGGSTSDLSTDSSSVGTCQPFSGASIEHNAFTVILCQVVKVLTGNPMRIIVVVSTVGVFVIFIFGKMETTKVVIYFVGVGGTFAAPTIILITTGKAIDCR